LAVAKNFATFTLNACMLVIAGWSFSADAVGLGNLDVRSYLGEPLNLRIGVITQQNEEIETGCFAVINAPGSEANVSRRDVRLTLVETRNSRYLEVRGTNAFNEPIGRLSIRAGCQADSGVIRDYPLLLDPAPLLAPPIANTDAAVNSTPRIIVQSSTVNAGNDAAAARWTVYEGDTFSSLARGIHPGDRARQNQYIVALRALNPTLAGIANNAPLPLNSQLVLPDLKTLSSAANRAARKRTQREPGVATRNARPKVVADKALRPLTVQAALPTATTRVPTPKAEEKNPAKADAASKTPEPKKVAAADGFRLRISGGDLDLSRSQGITDETRAQLRERFAALDADDQTAQLLALKNTVKQIEKRLNEMQLKMATLPASGTLAMPPAEAVPAIAPTVPPVVEKVPSEVTATSKPAPTPALTPSPPAPQKATEPAKPDNRGNTSTDFTPLIVIALSILALAALVWWVLKRRAANSLDEHQQTRGKNSSSDEFNTWVNDPDTELPGETEAPKAAWSSSIDRTTSKSSSLRNNNGFGKTEVTVSTNRFAADGAARSTAHTEASASVSAPALAPARDQSAELHGKPYTNPHTSADIGFTLPNAVPLSPFATPDRAKADSKPIATSDLVKTTDTFDLDLDLDQQGSSTLSTDQTSEDRLRRLRYMHERYPELAARTVSIDEPESVIHAARLYYEDNQLGKACELLIYAVEERPQETRFWLAQFELFRLEKMAPQFADLAQKFELLFGTDKSWPKVQQAGLELDSSNPLFSGANGSDQFDAAAENWLDAPVGGDAATQNISEALIADLRASLFAEHRVTHADFEHGPALLNSMGGRGQ
jgi:hypothetical protein